MSENFCWICGFPLDTHQIAAEFTGNVCDYVERLHGNVCFTMCDECWKEFQRKSSGGIALARVKAMMVMQQDSEDRERGNSYC